jgi:V8-like Glu-specific endopeptidase
VTAWFNDRPLDFTRDETRAAERLVTTGYSTNIEVLALAKNVGLDLAQLHQMNPVRFLVREILEKARLADRLLTLVGEVLSDPTQAGIHDELLELVVGHEAAIRDAVLRRGPSLATLAKLPPTIDSWAPTDAEPTSTFERTINAVAGFLDPADFRRWVAEAEVRTARVEISGKAEGTGFLVGPDLLMTNWHVVEHSVHGAVARFDHSTASPGRPVAFAADWRVAYSPHDSEANEVSPDGPEAGTWDFALVRLAEPVGEQAIGRDSTTQGVDRRGYYQLDWGPYAFESAEPLIILGHPNGGAIQLSYASPAGARVSSKRNRVRYNTNTSGGSSGSPVFNRDFRVIALHNAAGKGAGHGMFNQGVPIAGIGTALLAQLDGRPELTTLGLA